MSQPLPRPTLRGNHRDWEVVEAEGELAALGRLKTGRTRPGVTRFDPRCFVNEEDVLIELALLGMQRIAPVYKLVGADDELRVHGYIEGQPLSAIRPPGTALTGSELAQIVNLFGELATIQPSAFALAHRCPPVLRPHTSTQFLQTLIRFTRRRVYAVHRPLLQDLFTALRIGPTVLSPNGPLAREAARLTDRPFCLLHGDLHRDNLIVAESDGMMWTIDWELALIGDPLYDLATHLHLMRYPPKQEHALLLRWARVMDAVLPGSADALARDLPRYLAYKRVQSVFTDVIRQAHLVQATPPAQLAEQLPRTVEMVHGAMRRAARPMGLGRVPSPRAVEAAYAAWYVSAPPVAPAAPLDRERRAATRPGGP
ncbi:phosphotransferase [Streptomyces mayteni]